GARELEARARRSRRRGLLRGDRRRARGIGVGRTRLPAHALRPAGAPGARHRFGAPRPRARPPAGAGAGRGQVVDARGEPRRAPVLRTPRLDTERREARGGVPAVSARRRLLATDVVGVVASLAVINLWHAMLGRRARGSRARRRWGRAPLPGHRRPRPPGG